MIPLPDDINVAPLAPQPAADGYQEYTDNDDDPAALLASLDNEPEIDIGPRRSSRLRGRETNSLVDDVVDRFLAAKLRAASVE